MVQKPDLYKGFLVLSNKTLLRKMTARTILKNCIYLHIYKLIYIYIYVLHLFTMYMCIFTMYMCIYILTYFIEN